MNSFRLFVIVSILFISCTNSSNNSSHAESVHEEKEEHVDEKYIEISKDQMNAVGITIDTFEMKDLQSTVKVNGLLSIPNQNKALVTSVTTGIIKTLLVQPGNTVKKGQLIATIINPDVAPIQQQLQIANAQIKMAEIEKTRQQELVEGNAAPLKNLQRIQTELATLRATKNALQQQLQTMGISASNVNAGNVNTTLRILAPISGTISEVISQIGSHVDASTPIAKIVNNQEIHLDIFVYEKDLPSIKEKQTIHFILTNLPGKEYDAEIYSISSAFANESKSIPVHAVVKGNKEGLIEGMNITAIISTGSNRLLAVPNESIVEYNGQDYIFVLADSINEKNKNGKEENILRFEKIPVVKSISDVGYTAITPINPLPANAKLVTKGAFFVLAKLTNVESDH